MIMLLIPIANQAIRNQPAKFQKNWSETSQDFKSAREPSYPIVMPARELNPPMSEQSSDIRGLQSSNSKASVLQ